MLHSNEDLLADANERIERYRKGNAQFTLQGPDGKKVPAGTVVRIEQKRHRFLFGCCTEWLFNIFKPENRFLTQPAQAELYEKYFAELYNFCTTQFYWYAYEREQGQPQYGMTQANNDWALQNHMIIKGHPMVWNWDSDPKWLSGKSAEEIITLQMARIDQLMKRFAGQITFWDVVNEPSGYNRKKCLKDSPLLTNAMESIGIQQFVQKAYQQARHSNPNANFLTNDFVLDGSYETCGIDPLVGKNGADLFDTVGFQSHMVAGTWPLMKSWDICERFSKYGKPIHFTEATILSGDPDGAQKRNANSTYQWLTTSAGEDRQAKEVTDFYTLLFSHPSVEAITWWAFTDDEAFCNGPAGMVRADMSPKPAYESLKDLIRNIWWTRLEVLLKRKRSFSVDSMAIILFKQLSPVASNSMLLFPWNQTFLISHYYLTNFADGNGWRYKPTVAFAT